MNIEYPGFGRIVVDGKTYDHDIVIEGGEVRKRDKGASRHLKGDFGHTPLSASEDIPWSGATLIVGTGYSGRLPIAIDVEDTAGDRGVELEVMATAEACRVLAAKDPSDVTAVLHVTC